MRDFSLKKGQFLETLVHDVAYWINDIESEPWPMGCTCTECQMGTSGWLDNCYDMHVITWPSSFSNPDQQIYITFFTCLTSKIKRIYCILIGATSVTERKKRCLFVISCKMHHCDLKLRKGRWFANILNL